MAENQLYDLLEAINQNLNAVVQNQVEIYAELERIKQDMEQEE